MAMGSRLSTSDAPSAAAVVRDCMVVRMNVRCCQLNAWYTSGATFERRPPKISPEIGTPAGFSQCGDIDGHCRAGAVKRELGCAAGASPVQGRLPFQSVNGEGGSPSFPSHHGMPLSETATLV